MMPSRQARAIAEIQAREVPWDELRQRWGGLLNVAAVLLFMMVTVLTVIKSNTRFAASKRLAPRHGV